MQFKAYMTELEEQAGDRTDGGILNFSSVTADEYASMYEKGTLSS